MKQFSNPTQRLAKTSKSFGILANSGSSTLILALMVCLALGISGCKKKSCEDWPEGFELYRTDSGKDVADCHTPLLKGWKESTIYGPDNARYWMELTPVQGLVDIQMNAGPSDEHFKPGTTFELAGTTGNPTQQPNKLYMKVNAQWYDQTVEYWSPTFANATVSAMDTTSGNISLEIEFGIKNTGSSGEEQHYRMELIDYPMPWNWR